ncbi:putative Group A glucokinaselike [Balamuthia mandrillaris]
MELSQEVTQTLKQWVAAESSAGLKYYVGVDIGGTNTRLALARAEDHDTFLQVLKVKADDTRKLIAFFDSVSDSIRDLLGVEASGACLAGAGRISPDGEVLDVTNFHGDATHRRLKRSELPSFLFPPTKTHFINDLEGTCYGVSSMNASGALDQCFKPLWGPASSDKVTLQPDHYLVLAVGTGLGIATLLSLRRSPVRGGFQVMPMEFGHVAISPVGPANAAYAEETRLLEYISEKLYNKEHAIEYEDIVSGRGLAITYKWVLDEANVQDESLRSLDAGKIAKNATNSEACPYAHKAMMLHFKFLMRIAKNLCIGLQVRGMLLAGDNQVNNNLFLEQNLESLRAEFFDHPKKAWIEDIDLFTQTKPVNLNLHGALYVARG